MVDRNQLPLIIREDIDMLTSYLDINRDQITIDSTLMKAVQVIAYLIDECEIPNKQKNEKKKKFPQELPSLF